MKNLYKTCAALFVAILGLTFASCSDDKDEPIDFNQLPSVAQKFITTYFGDTKVSSVKYDKDKNDHEYEVKLQNGFELTFNVAGEWTDVDAPDGKAIPNGIAPEPIESFVLATYPESGINEIEKIKTGYDVELINGIDLKFNLQGEYVGVDA